MITCVYLRLPIPYHLDGIFRLFGHFGFLWILSLLTSSALRLLAAKLSKSHDNEAYKHESEGDDHCAAPSWC